MIQIREQFARLKKSSLFNSLFLEVCKGRKEDNHYKMLLFFGSRIICNANVN